MSFTKPVRLEIKERADNRSELSGTNSRPLVCAHLFYMGRHKSKRKKINNHENGIYVTDFEHYAQHLIFKGKPQVLGLSHEDNDFTLEVFEEYFDKIGIEKEQFYEKIVEAIDHWKNYYDENYDMKI